MPPFSTTRNIELSTIFYLETQINASWSDITIVKSFLSAYNKTLPVVSIRLTDVFSDRLELGATTLYPIYTIAVDVFATSDGQRIDLGDFILDQAKEGWIFYTHSKVSGATTLDRVAAGRITVDTFATNTRLDFGDEVSNPDRFRQSLVFNVRKNT